MDQCQNLGATAVGRGPLQCTTEDGPDGGYCPCHQPVGFRVAWAGRSPGVPMVSERGRVLGRADSDTPGRVLGPEKGDVIWRSAGPGQAT